MILPSLPKLQGFWRNDDDLTVLVLAYTHADGKYAVQTRSLAELLRPFAANEDALLDSLLLSQSKSLPF